MRLSTKFQRSWMWRREVSLVSLAAVILSPGSFRMNRCSTPNFSTYSGRNREGISFILHTADLNPPQSISVAPLLFNEEKNFTAHTADLHSLPMIYMFL
ncbi:hypothetical protein GE061_017799 [Apolygus lucorum]|uniref:Uncharacterized protein n=1 Tax=Apolygus lucorum TaxID=248454 RepID=A0A8S9XG25_APOLU|nr:hypothetical protein GE061_017799 [Apolygus lucorum]